MIAGSAALCEGMVLHRREAPAIHQFRNRVSYVWIDPDHPEELCNLHPAWSHRHPSPARFRRSDYGVRADGSLVVAARRDLGPALGHVPQGPVRMLTQVRRWGWLFNPITIYLVWDAPESTVPSGVVLEVTNTPWKERTRYPVPLERRERSLVAEFDKTMHVSPFLGMAYRYRLTIADRDDVVAVDIDVVDDTGDPLVHTSLRLDRRRVTRAMLGRALRSSWFPTHQVSVGIHAQALRLWSKGVPYIPHPRHARRQSDASTTAEHLP